MDEKYRAGKKVTYLHTPITGLFKLYGVVAY